MHIVGRRSFLTGALATAVIPPAYAQPRLYAAPARDFLDSIGVNTHISSEPYASRFDAVKRLVADLGVHHIRDELRPTNDIGRWQELFHRYGVKSTMLVSPSTNTVPEMLAYIEKLGVEKLAAIEGQNEGDADWFMAHKAARGNWSRTVVDYQREVFHALRQSYGEKLPVISPSVINWKPADVALLRGAAPFSDFVAIHSYPQHAEEPETTADFAAVAWYLKHMRDAFKPGAPAMATEAGYNTSVKPGGSGVSETAASIYLPRMLLNNFALGIARTFLYQLLDGGDDPNEWEHHFGLVRHDDTPKPSFVAISNLVRGLRHPQADAAGLRRPMLRITSVSPAVRVLLLSHGDGTATAALWRPVRCWDVEKAADIEVPAEPATLKADRPLQRAERLVPNDSAEWHDARVKGGDISVPVGGKVVLVRLTPQA